MWRSALGVDRCHLGKVSDFEHVGNAFNVICAELNAKYDMQNEHGH